MPQTHTHTFLLSGIWLCVRRGKSKKNLRGGLNQSGMREEEEIDLENERERESEGRGRRKRGRRRGESSKIICHSRNMVGMVQHSCMYM